MLSRAPVLLAVFSMRPGCDAAPPDVTEESLAAADRWRAVAADAQPLMQMESGLLTTHAPRRMRVDLTADGATLTSTQGGTLEIALAGRSSATTWQPAAPHQPVPVTCATPGCVQQAEQALFDDMSQWWIGRQHGLLHGFTIQEPSHTPLHLGLSLEAAAVTVHDGERAVVTAADGSRWHYGRLEGWDARGDRVPARFAVLGDGRLDIVVSAPERAAYPITLSAMVAPEDAQVVLPAGIPESADVELTLVGDTDGDGYPDGLLVASRRDRQEADGPSQWLQRCQGGAGGLTCAPLELPAMPPHSRLLGAYPAGDLDSDGYDDSLLSIQRSDGEHTWGHAVVVYGGPSGTPARQSVFDTRAYGPDLGGFIVAPRAAGDLDGDGYDDILFYHHVSGAQHTASASRLTVLRGGPQGATQAATVLLSDEGMHTAGCLGEIGDLDGDGRAEVMLSAISDDQQGTLAGAVQVFTDGALPGFDAPTWLRAPDGGPQRRFGTRCTGLGDVNGDGLDDALISALSVEAPSAVYVLPGRQAGIDAAPLQRLDDPAPAPRGSSFGLDIARIGDLDGDGYADAAVSARHALVDGIPSGLVHLYRGGPEGLQEWTPIAPTSPTNGGRFGRRVHAADIDQDGIPEILIHASGAGPQGARTWIVPAWVDDDGDGVHHHEDCDDQDAAQGRPQRDGALLRCQPHSAL